MVCAVAWVLKLIKKYSFLLLSFNALFFGHCVDQSRSAKQTVQRNSSALYYLGYYCTIEKWPRITLTCAVNSVMQKSACAMSLLLTVVLLLVTVY